MPNMFGRLPRTFRPMLPFSALLGTSGTLPLIPDRTGYMDHVKVWGPMLNNQIGDCTLAAKGHILQAQTQASRGWEFTDPDQYILQGYMEAGGYVPDDIRNPQTNATDNGCNMQELAKYMVNVGLPIPPVNGRTRHKYLGTVEVDHHNLDHMARCTYVFAACDIGFAVPDYIMQQSSTTWDYRMHQPYRIEGGHDVALLDYELDKSSLISGQYAVKAFHLCSWGDQFTMTAAFARQFVDEAYGYADLSWLDITGHTPSNLTKAQLLQILGQKW